MSTPQTVDLGGLNLKEWSLIILLISLAIVFVAWSVAFAFAMVSSPAISITGEIDLGMVTGVVIGIAMVSVTLVAQKLTAQQQAAAVTMTDNTWLESEKNGTK